VYIYVYVHIYKPVSPDIVQQIQVRTGVGLQVPLANRKLGVSDPAASATSAWREN
jgi:hypothetical protein